MKEREKGHLLSLSHPMILIRQVNALERCIESSSFHSIYLIILSTNYQRACATICGL